MPKRVVGAGRSLAANSRGVSCPTHWSPSRPALVLWLPLLLSLAFGGFVALPQVRANAILLRTFLITAGLLVWLVGWCSCIVLDRKAVDAAIAGGLTAQAALPAGLRAHLDPAVLGLVLATRSTSTTDSSAARLNFAYALFDMLLVQYWRHKKYTLGFGLRFRSSSASIYSSGSRTTGSTTSS